MRMSLGWLKSYVEIKLSPPELAELLTMAGLEVEEIAYPGKGLKGLLTAKVVSVSNHPAADNLSVCRVDLAGAVKTVVCGAPNVRAGLVTAFAPAGVTLPGGLVVQEAEIRSQLSQGMLCSLRELGIGDEHEGVWELPDDLEAGQDLAQATFLDDVVFEIAITANRGDCLSAIGIAREIAALTGTRIRLPNARQQRLGGKIDEYIKIDIKNPDLCRRYTGMVVLGLEIKPSPLWLASRLRLVGIRPINNIVDITNYVLMEWGQPLHGFDYEKLSNHHIIVRRAAEGEKITTLDGVERKLVDTNLLICDGDSKVAIAGVMGGLYSEVTPETTNVFIESAYFDPTSIRKTSSSLGLISESSYRFERGVDPEGVIQALQRSASLMEELGGGQIITGYTDCYPKQIANNQTNLRVSRVNSILGLHLSTLRISEILLALGMETKAVGEDLLHVSAPSYRRDIYREIDLIEEIARIEGYDRIPTTMPVVPLVSPVKDSFKEFRNSLQELMVTLGFTEVLNYSFDRRERQQIVAEADQSDKYVRIMNPATEEAAIMRRFLLPGLLKNLSNNLKFGTQELRIFELKPVFIPGPKGELPKQRQHFAALLAGHFRPASWNLTPAEVDFFDLKGVVETVCLAVGAGPVTFVPLVKKACHPGKCASVMIGDQPVGYLGVVHPNLIGELDLQGEPVVFELDIHELHKLSIKQVNYMRESRYPSALRDLAILVDDTLAAGQILEEIRSLDLPLLDDVKLFDVYQGDRLEAGKKSLAFALRYKSPERSLTDQEVQQVHDQLIEHLGEKFEAKLR